MISLMAAILVLGCTAAAAKEFNLDLSFANGTMQFSPNEITVNKGDTVKLNVNIGGMQRNEAFNMTGRQNGTRPNGTRPNGTMGSRNFTRPAGQGGRNFSNGIEFNIDEFNVHAVLQPGQTQVEFVADRAGEFRYYVGESSGTIIVNDNSG